MFMADTPFRNEPGEDSRPSTSDSFTAPQITLPKGGGALRGIGEKFKTNPANGTGSWNIPISMSPGRQRFGPDLAVSYDSGAGNGPFGLGWSLTPTRITRRTDKGLPRYEDRDERNQDLADIFVLSGQEDLVPVPDAQHDGGFGATLKRERGYRVVAYRPRTEGLFARIERWTRESNGEQHWRTISKDNVLSIFGPDEVSRISDPAMPDKVFSWLIRCSFDDKGNAILHDYERETDDGVDTAMPGERNRLRGANRYLSRIRYGNRVPLNRGLIRGACTWDIALAELDAASWMFSVVLDFGEGRYREAPPDNEGFVYAEAHAEAQTPWPARTDPFSTYRAGFEVRTHRLCMRALVFHHIPHELGVDACLVRSTSFHYRQRPEGALLESVIQCGHRRQRDGLYLTSTLPRLDFRYTCSPLEEPGALRFEVVEAEPSSLADLSGGLDGSRCRWLDLNGEGIAGIFSEQGGAWFYKRNLGDGRFARAEAVPSSPVSPRLRQGRQLLDVTGDGNLDLVDFTATGSGYFERTVDAGWTGFRTFGAMPRVDWSDPNMRFLDLTGDGVADILITEQEALVWHPSLLQWGFGAGVKLRVPHDDDVGPAVIFADSTESIYLADMSGDGLSDIVRVRNGEVCYWPNLGYGHFGAKITMSHAPWFDEPDTFDQKRIRLSDTDGSGVTDLLYLRQDGVDIYLNLSGNGWSPAKRIENFAPIDDLSAVSVTDFLGRGTACLLWSTPLPAMGLRQLRYIDLMRGLKPNLLNFVDNNMGAQTRVEYTSSTEFYLADARAGAPWITRLPFPVHVVSRTETRDLVSGNRFETRYAYHHGFFDGLEREFRGFGRVDQWVGQDIPSVGGPESTPPVFIKTWFHTGVYLAGERVSRQLAHEYSGAGGSVFAETLDDTILPPDLTPFEAREACRALRGVMLRQETYALDGTAREAMPYAVVENNFTIAMLQPKKNNRYAVFFTHARESLSLACERNPGDPRISHALTLAVDEFGNVLKSAAIGYGRAASSHGEQQTRTLATLTESRFANAVWRDDDYRAPLIAQTQVYQLTGPEISSSRRLGFLEVARIASQAQFIAYDAEPHEGRAQKRLIKEARTFYRSDDLTRLMPLGALESLALPGETFKRRLTKGLLDLFRAKASQTELREILASREAGYVDLDGDGPFWAPSGRVHYSPEPAPAPDELAFARAHFFLVHRYEDPFGATTRIGYDSHDLMPIFSRDAVGNEIRARADYRVLQIEEVTDANGNRSLARFDAVGLLAGTVIQGKADGPVEGDNFDDFVADVAPLEIKRFFEAHDPTALARIHLGTATTRILYDLARTPVCAASITRETHVAELKPGQETRVQLAFAYSDGFERIAQMKAQAEPGPLRPDDADAPVVMPRWVGTGATIYDDKGKPVRRYEPFFCSTPHFGIERWGVSDVLFYDPLSRVVATLHPDATYQKVVFDQWTQTTFDANDTTTFDPAGDPDVGDYFQRLPDNEYSPTWYRRRIDGALGPAEQAAAEKAARHADTPTRAYFDGLGRAFLSVADNGLDDQGRPQLYRTLSVLDIEGNVRAVVDALGRVVMRYDYDIAGQRIRQASMEAGERWLLGDVTGKPIRSWNSRDYAFRTEYDPLRRPLRSFVRGGTARSPHDEAFHREILFERTIYGDSAETGLNESERRAANLRGQPFRHFDGAGVAKTPIYDFKGNSLKVERQFARDYKRTPDWSHDQEVESERFASSSVYDALNRAIAVTAPDGSVFRPTFNDASLLEKVDVNLRGKHRRGEPVWSRFVEHINYDAKRQRTVLRYANGATTTYDYDEKTFRLTRLKTRRASGTGGVAARLFRDAAVVQGLHYTYDPIGNITRIEDAALRTTFHANQRIGSAGDYTYDPLYRLIEASGREQMGQSAFDFRPKDGDDRDYPFVGAADLRDLEALRNYVERYEYDPVGNFRALSHRAAHDHWRRDYVYDEASQIEPERRSNRLSRTILGTKDRPVTEPNAYDACGNIVAMAHLPTMAWNFKDALSATARQRAHDDAAETTFYVYDAGGERVRKVTERRGGSRKTERLYVGGFEIHREFDADGVATFERETLHVLDDTRRIALVETITRDDGDSVDDPAPAIRYQLGNHLDSACLELDDNAELITYEEYGPYGNSVFQAGRSAAEVSLKRYRYTGKERDEENGFNYHGARYYAPWLGGWVSPDPIGIRDAVNLYRYVSNNPVKLLDPTGTSVWQRVAGALKAVGGAFEVAAGGQSGRCRGRDIM